MIYKYIRFSTEKQDKESQLALIDNYCGSRGLVANKTILDEAISGASELSKRELSNLLSTLKEGDTLIISELSRLTRKGTIELNEIISTYFKPARIRLIICNYGLDIDCANIDAMTELMLNMMATFARIERDSIVTRTIGGIKAAHEKGRKSGKASVGYGKGEDYEANKARGIEKTSRTKVNNFLSGDEWGSICKAVETVVPDIKKYQNTKLEYPRLGYSQFRNLSPAEWEAVTQTLKSYEELLGRKIMHKMDYDYKYVMSRFKYPFGSRFRSTAENFVKYA